MTSPLDRHLPRVQVRAAGVRALTRVDAPVLLAANHTSRLDMGFVLHAAPAHLHASPLAASVALRLRRSPVVFPEHGVSPNGNLGTFHDDALATARSRRVAVVPVAIRGSLGLDVEPSRWQLESTPRVLVRFGDPLRDPSVEELRDAVARLLVEDATTWWESLSDNRPALEASHAGSDDGWLAAWRGLGPADRPGEGRRPTIWR